MAIIYTYTKVTPQPLDSMVITDVSDKNFTKTALIGEAVNESIAAGTNICLGWDSNTGITTINSASYSFEGAYEPFYWQTELNKDLCGVVSTVDILKFLITPVNGTDVISTGEPLSYDSSNPDVWNLTQFAYGGGGNVGYVPAGGSAGEYLDGGTGLWTTLPADQNTTYDLDSIQNGFDADIRLVGSDATTDIVKLVAGTNITLTDTGSNITIEAATGGYSWDITDGTPGGVSTVSNAEVVKFVGSGGITVTNAAGTSPYEITIDGSGAGGGTVTNVSTTSGVNALSLATVNPTTTPAITLSTVGGSTGQYLDNTGNWSTPPSSGCANAVGSFAVTSGAAVTIDTCGETVTFGSSDSTIEIAGNNTAKTLDLTIKELPCASSTDKGAVLVSNTLYAGPIESAADGNAYPVQVDENCQAVVRLPSSSSPITGTFEPVMVTRGANGTDPIAFHPDVAAMTQSFGRYRVYEGLAYIEFFVEFSGVSGVYLQETLGIALGGESPTGLETLPGLANLPTNPKMNACVTIADCGLSSVSDIDGAGSWNRAVVGGKLNKFNPGGPRLASAIWFMNGGVINSPTDKGVRQSPTWGTNPIALPSGDFWLQYNTEEGNPYIAGSLTVSLT